MKSNPSRLSAFIIFVFLFSGCTLNIFGGLTPQNPDNVNDVNSLVELGDSSLRKADYPTAQAAYEKALSLDPVNSYALEGASTAYCYKIIPISNFIKLLTADTMHGMGHYLNDLYSVSEYSSGKLWLIVNGKADGQIPQNDLNVNMSFFLFNSLNAVFGLADTDNNGNIYQDGGDLIIIQDDLTISNKFYTITNDFLASFNILNALKLRKQNFDRVYGRSIVSLDNVVNGLKTPEMKQSFSNTALVLFEIKNDIDNAFSAIGLDGSNANSFSNFLLLFGYTNYTPGNAGPSVLFLLTNAGDTNKTEFTNSLVKSGFTNSDGSPSETAFTGAMTNLYPDLSPSSGSINSTLSNYYGF